MKKSPADHEPLAVVKRIKLPSGDVLNVYNRPGTAGEISSLERKETPVKIFIALGKAILIAAGLFLLAWIGALALVAPILFFDLGKWEITLWILVWVFTAMAVVIAL